MSDQVPFGATADDFARNPEPRCPCLLLVDTSGSMTGNPIQQLNEGIATFRSELISDPLALKRVEVAIVTFGGQVRTVCDFATAENFSPPSLSAQGDTPMGTALLRGVEMLQQRKAQYKTNGVAYYRPWLFLITDGAPTDEWEPAAQEVKSGEASKAFAFFAVGVEGANFEILRRLAVREPLHLRGLEFRSLFQWLSKSLKSVSHSQAGDTVPLSNPTAPGGWASV